MRKMLGRADDDYIKSIMKAIEGQSKKTLFTWCYDFAIKEIIPIYQKYKESDYNPLECLQSSLLWFKGELKLPEVKNKILKCHQEARLLEKNPIAQACLRAIGQASAIVHVATHSLGFVFYTLAAVTYNHLGLNKLESEYDEFARYIANKLEQELVKIAIKDDPNSAKIKWYC